MNPDGTLHIAKPTDCMWWANYVILPPAFMTQTKRTKFLEKGIQIEKKQKQKEKKEKILYFQKFYNSYLII